jgi:hypothetical protein
VTSHDDLLVAVLEEAIYSLDTAGEAQGPRPQYADSGLCLRIREVKGDDWIL